MLKKLLIAAAAVALVPTGTALAHDRDRYGYRYDHYRGDHWRGDHYRYRDHRHYRSWYRDRLRELKWAYRHGYISRREYRAERRALERQRRYYRYGYRR